MTHLRSPPSRGLTRALSFPSIPRLNASSKFEAPQGIGSTIIHTNLDLSEFLAEPRGGAFHAAHRDRRGRHQRQELRAILFNGRAEPICECGKPVDITHAIQEFKRGSGPSQVVVEINAEIVFLHWHSRDAAADRGGTCVRSQCKQNARCRYLARGRKPRGR